jgi:hypothetical protein
VRLRIAEINQDSVAHIAGDKPAKTLDDLCDAAMVSADDPAQILGIEPRGQRRRTDQIAEHHRQLSPLCFGGNRWRGLGQGLRRLRPERGDCLEHDFAMTEQDTDFLEIGLAQLGQDLQLDGVIAKCPRVPLERQTAQPRRNIHQGATFLSSLTIALLQPPPTA